MFGTSESPCNCWQQQVLRAEQARQQAETTAGDALDEIRRLVDKLTESEQARQEAERRAAYEERRANTLRDERDKCTEAARLNGTADVAALRAELDRMRTLAKEATNGWACYAKRKIEHDGIARLHREIDALASTPPSQEPT